jgi:voltage-gated sodium channel
MYGCDHQIWGYEFESECLNPKAYPLLGSIYFISFVLLGTMIILNLFIGVIMNSMSEVHDDLEERMALEKTLEGNIVNTPDEIFEKIEIKIDEINKEIKELKKRY